MLRRLPKWKVLLRNPDSRLSQIEIGVRHQFLNVAGGKWTELLIDAEKIEEKITEKTKEVEKKIKKRIKEKQKRSKDFKKFKKIHRLK